MPRDKIFLYHYFVSDSIANNHLFMFQSFYVSLYYFIKHRLWSKTIAWKNLWRRNEKMEIGCHD